MQLQLAPRSDNFPLIVVIATAAFMAVLSVVWPTLAIMLGLVFPVVLVVLAAYVKRPELFVYSMFFLAPFHFYVTDKLLTTPSLGGTLSLGGLYQDIWPIGLVAIWFFHSISSGKFVVTRPPAAIVILLLSAWALLHLFSSVSLTGALFGLRNLIRYAILPFLLPVLLTTSKQLRGVFLAGMLGMTLAVVLSLNEAPAFIAWALSEVGLNLAALPADLRFVGIFRSEGQNATAVSNSFGIAISLYTAYSIGRAFNTRSLATRFLFLFCAALLLVFLFLTFSRRGYFTVVGATVLLLWWSKRAPAKRVRVLLSFGLLFVLILVLLQTLPIGELIIGRSTIRVLDNPSFMGRQLDWQAVWEDVTQNVFRFIWGFGLGSTGPVGIRFNVSGATHVHNYYLMIWHQLGIIGLGLFLAILVRVLVRGFRIGPRLHGLELNTEVWFSIVAIISLVLNGLLGTTFEAYPNDMIFWTSIMLIGAAGRFARATDQDKQRT